MHNDVNATNEHSTQCIVAKIAMEELMTEWLVQRCLVVHIDDPDGVLSRSIKATSDMRALQIKYQC
jgi:hypothetical protein